MRLLFHASYASPAIDATNVPTERALQDREADGSFYAHRCVVWQSQSRGSTVYHHRTKSRPRFKILCQEHARGWGTPLIELRIGSRTFAPFFTGPYMPAGTWSGADFEKLAEVCLECGEPANLSESGKCQWCDIAKELKESAPRRSVLTMYVSLGVQSGIPLAFDGMEPRGRLVTESRRQSLE